VGCVGGRHPGMLQRGRTMIAYAEVSFLLVVHILFSLVYSAKPEFKLTGL
jgi:hypothetical protein